MPTLTTLVSCDKAKDIKFTIPGNEKFCYENKFSINFKTSLWWHSPIKVRIEGPSIEGLSLVKDKVETYFYDGTLNFVISDDIKEDTLFKFDVVFDLSEGNEKVTEKIKRVEGIKVNYFPAHEDNEDSVEVVDEVVEKVNEWSFDFDIKFSAQPKSTVKIRIIRDDELLTCPDELPVIQEGSLYKLHLPITLDFDVSENKFLAFNLNLAFTNSYGQQQEITVNDLGANFLSKKTEEVPSSYFNITEENGDVVLHGLYEDVIKKVSLDYSILKIPEGITKIDAYAFPKSQTETEYFEPIQDIIFSDNLITSIGKNAFEGFTTIRTIDISKYDQTPEWVSNPIQYFSGLSHVGYIWKNCDITDEQIAKMGLTYNTDSGDTKTWQPVAEEKIVPEDAYFIITDEATNEKVLRGFKQEYLEELRKYNFVKIPNEIDRIGDSALQFLNKISADDGYRVVLLNHDLKTLEGESGLSHSSLNGNLYIPPGIKNIPDYYFYDAFSWSEMEATLEFDPNSELETIGDYNFNGGSYVHVGGLSGSIIFPNTLKSIGYESFWNNSGITKIKFDANLQNVGYWCFGGLETLNCIDFSAYEEIPDWLEVPNHIFDLSQPAKGVTGTILYNSKISKDEFEKSWLPLLKAQNFEHLSDYEYQPAPSYEN